MSKKGKIDLLTVILLGVAAIILVVIVAGTLWAFSGRISNHDRESVLTADTSKDIAVYPDIGTLRAATADSTPVTVVLTIYFPYSAKDSAFQEELVKKNRAIRRSILEWFSTRTISEIDELGETRVKAALLTEINESLVLGQIDVLYFSDYLIIE